MTRIVCDDVPEKTKLHRVSFPLYGYSNDALLVQISKNRSLGFRKKKKKRNLKKEGKNCKKKDPGPDPGTDSPAQSFTGEL